MGITEEQLKQATDNELVMLILFASAELAERKGLIKETINTEPQEPCAAKIARKKP